jgi:hypothetical protein
VIEIVQDLQTLTDDLVRLFALHVANEADAASVVLKLRVIETLLRRWTKPGLGGFCVQRLMTHLQLAFVLVAAFKSLGRCMMHSKSRDVLLVQSSGAISIWDQTGMLACHGFMGWEESQNLLMNEMGRSPN